MLASLATARRRTEREELVAFFELHDQMRVVEVDLLLDEYAGREVELFEALEREYNVHELGGSGIVPGQEPAAQAPEKPKRVNIFDKLTDVSMYTGASSHRFDKDGVGRGLTGRDRLHVGKGSHGVHGDGSSVFKGNSNHHKTRSDSAGDTGIIDAASFLTRQW